MQDFEGALAEARDQAAAAGVGGLIPAEVTYLAGASALRASHHRLHLPQRRHVVGRDGLLIDVLAAEDRRGHDLLERLGLGHPRHLAFLARLLLGGRLRGDRSGVVWRWFARRRFR
ncbi:MAG: hypothetical protein IPN16_24365 [Gemmatimonadetes bacterium]|nr:hypothetical protein [Gemmatimonadota bacterium]